MSDRPTREEKRRQTGQRLYREAVRLFEERGYDEVTVGDIVEAAGVSVPTFYAHYASKEALLMSVPTREQLTALFAGQPAEAPVGRQVRGAITRWLSSMDPEARALVLERWRIIARTPSLRIRTGQFERLAAGLLLDALPRDGDQPAHGPSAEVVVNVLMSAYTHILFRWAGEDGRRDMLVVADEVLDEVAGEL